MVSTVIQLSLKIPTVYEMVKRHRYLGEESVYYFFKKCKKLPIDFSPSLRGGKKIATTDTEKTQRG